MLNKVIDVAAMGLSAARRPLRAAGARVSPQRRVDLSNSYIVDRNDRFIVIKPNISSERGERDPFLHKNNHLIARAIAPDFVHFIAEIVSASGRDRGYCPIILLPGILLNGNFFRMPTMGLGPEGIDFKALDNNSSFSNILAGAGLDLFLAHPPYGDRVYTRYVQRHLGVKNPFLRDLNFDDLVDNLNLYIDFVTHYTGQNKVVLLGYSLGGMVSQVYEAMFQDERVAGMIIMGSPAKLTDQPIIRYLRGYNLTAGVLPATPVDPLKFFGRYFKYFAKGIAWTPDALLKYLPILNEIYNFDRASEVEIATLVATLTYATESITPGMLHQIVEVMSARRGLLSADGRIDYFEHFPRINKPVVYIAGEKDTLAPEANVRMAFNRIGTPEADKKLVVIPDAGHLGLVTRARPMEQSVELVIDFMRQHGRVA